MQHTHGPSCHSHKQSVDWLLWGSLSVIVTGCIVSLLYPDHGSEAGGLWGSVLSGSHTMTELMVQMSWGLVFALVFVGLLELVPREKVNQLVGGRVGFPGLVRATMAGLVLDLCSHGILLVAMKFYERGLSLGQVMAFLVASPWNSFSMTMILWSLIGLPLTLGFIGLSCVIALITGAIFDRLENSKVLPSNPNRLAVDFDKKVPWFLWEDGLSRTQLIQKVVRGGLHESRMILRWIFFGVVLTAFVKVLLTPEQFQTYFGPDLTGVLLTLLSATVLEVCSEGSAPLAAELVTTAKAPGNGFTFLMAGVSTDYTEVMALKETTGSWKIALFLPLVTLPQILLIGLLINWFV